MCPIGKTSNAYFIFLPGVRRSDRRGIGVLQGVDGCMGLAELQAFFAQEELAGRTILATFGHWVGKPEGSLPKNKCHGWKKSQHGGLYVDCWVFKAQDFRLYGFVFNPFDNDRRFRVFVPVCHAAKHEFNTETRLLDRVCKVLTVSRDLQWREDS